MSRQLSKAQTLQREQAAPRGAWVRVSAPHMKRQQLLMFIGQEQRAGRIASTGREQMFRNELGELQVGYWVERLAEPRPTRPRWQWMVPAGAAALLFVGGVLAMVWQARNILMVMGALALLTAWASRLRHSGACTGLHCEGCRS